MAGKPIKHGTGWRVRWTYAGRSQSLVERLEADAKRASAWITSKGNQIGQDDWRIKGRLYLHENVEIARRAANRGRTFGEVAASYLAGLTVTDQRRRNVTLNLRKHYAHLLDLPITEINAGHLNDLHVALTARLKHDTVCEIMRLGKAIMSHAYDLGYTTWSPASTKPTERLTFKTRISATSSREAIDVSTFHALIDLSDGQLRAMLLTLGTVGTRLAELCGLRVGDVRKIGGVWTIAIRGSVGDDREWQPRVKAGRTDGVGHRVTTVRPLPIEEELIAALAPLLLGRPASAPLFPARDGDFWSPGVWRSGPWSRLVRSAIVAGIDLPDGFTPHSLRHSMATWLSAVLTPAQLKERMRHRDIKTTMRYYHDNAVARARELDAVRDLMRRPDAA